MAKFADHMEKIAGGVAKGYQKIEDGVVSGYKKIENAFVNTFLAREGESAADARARVAAYNAARAEAQKALVEKNLEASRNVGKHH